MHLVPKVNRMLVLSVEMPHKLCGWHARKKQDHMHCVDDTLEEGPREMCRWQAEGNMTTRICEGVQDIIYPGTFQPDPRKEEIISMKIRTSSPVCVQLSCLQLSLTRPSHPYILSNKRNRKGNDYIFIDQCCCLSLLYNSVC